MRQAKRRAPAGRRPVARTNTNNTRSTKPAARRRRRNGAEGTDAAQLYETFHGAPSDSVREFEVPNRLPRDLADLGQLIELRAWMDEDNLIQLTPRGDVRATAAPVRGDDGEPYGGQIYFVGGDQSLDLAALGIEADTGKDHIMIGPCDYIAYKTSKDFHSFAPTVYEHEFGEVTGECPFLAYDTRNRRVYLVGGAYRVERPGIVN